MPLPRILVVEDEGIVARDLQGRLQRLGYEVPAVASSGQEAITRAAEARPDLILMDIVLKGEMDGIEAADVIGQRFGIPIVYLTAYGDETTLQRAKVTGPYGYVLKPFSERELRINIEVALYRSRMERKLRGVERWLASTIRRIGSGIIETDARGSLVSIDPVAEEITGWSQQEAKGRPISDVFPLLNTTTHAPLPNPLLQALEEDTVVTVTERGALLGRDGKEVPVDCCAAPVRNGGGEVVSGGVLVFHDTSRLRETESALRRSEHLFRLLVESVKDYAILVLDPEGQIITWNAGGERIMGYSSQEVIGRHFSLFYTQAARAQEHPEHELEVAGTRGQYEEDGWRVRKDGSLFWANVVITPLHDEKGQLYGFVKITRDMTERRQLEETLRQRVDELAEAHRRKDEFLAMLAHELRNPLAPALNGVHMLSMLGPSDERLQHHREIVERQIKQVARLVDDLLDVARITHGTIVLRKEWVDVAEIVDNAVETVRPVVDSKGHELSISVPPEPVRLEGDPLRLQQVVVNLLDNAAKYTPPGGRIWLSVEVEGQRDRETERQRDGETREQGDGEGERRPGAREAGGGDMGDASLSPSLLHSVAPSQVVIRVRDTGAGIPPQLLPYVFDLFSQGCRSLARSEGGLGIGLTIVKRLVEMHGGSVTACSKGEDQGSEFVVRLPLGKAKGEGLRKDEGGRMKDEEASFHPSSFIPQPFKRVLIVEDNVDAAETLSEMVEMWGYEVSVAHNGKRALEAASHQVPHIVLCDLGLPDLDGCEVARRLQSLAPAQRPVMVAVTGYGQESDRCRTHEAGFYAHLTKPVDPEEMRELLSRVVADSQC
jgi:PAS domain S-box-containing protein